MSDTPRTDAIAPVGYARAQDLLLYSEVWAGYSNKPADENGHPPVALYTQDQVDMLLTALRAQLAERDAEIARLKAHAEAMALDLEYIFQHDDASGGSEALPAYRAAYPKED